MHYIIISCVDQILITQIKAYFENQDCIMSYFQLKTYTHVHYGNDIHSYIICKQNWEIDRDRKVQDFSEKYAAKKIQRGWVDRQHRKYEEESDEVRSKK